MNSTDNSQEKNLILFNYYLEPNSEILTQSYPISNIYF